MISQLKTFKRTVFLYADRLQRSGLYGASAADADVESHLREAVEWLKRAQDAGMNMGVSYGTAFGGPFLESYPETTGYIIPTFLKLADFYKDETLAQRAIQMGEWESQVQMESGAVMGGRFNTNRTPAVFNTGMVLLGWAALYERTSNPIFLRSLCRASEWLLSLQELGGEWKKGNSKFANTETTVYNVKSGLGVMRSRPSGADSGGDASSGAQCRILPVETNVQRLVPRLLPY